MPRFQLVISNRFRRDLRRLDAAIHRRVLEAIEQLQEDPYQGSQLTNVRIGQWRMRVGDYRIRYDVEGDRVLLYRVRHRKDIYRD
ncbi:MAG: type II toxin-antitoxin system mRNA interferase toxin, RelE/StbE family [Candidatus Tectomicrobia bacterium]|nr:type II toxin-antitoxin system mRNA interferase toxin, RelE/StbE family [Candidatus Tectomicrobia bacterium]